MWRTVRMVFLFSWLSGKYIFFFSYPIIFLGTDKSIVAHAWVKIGMKNSNDGKLRWATYSLQEKHPILDIYFFKIRLMMFECLRKQNEQTARMYCRMYSLAATFLRFLFNSYVDDPFHVVLARNKYIVTDLIIPKFFISPKLRNTPVRR